MLPRKCKFCERRYAKTEHLKRHQRSHTGEKPYKCIQCGKVFSRSDVLTRHQKAHTQPASTRNEDEDNSAASENEQSETCEQPGTVEASLIEVIGTHRLSMSNHEIQAPPSGNLSQKATAPNRDPSLCRQPSLSMPVDYTAVRSYPPHQWQNGVLEMAAAPNWDHGPLDWPSFDRAEQIAMGHYSRLADDMDSLNSSRIRNTEPGGRNISDVDTLGLVNNFLSAEPDCDSYQAFGSGSSYFDLGSLSASDEPRASQINNHLTSEAQPFTIGIQDFNLPNEACQDQVEIGTQLSHDHYGLIRVGARVSSDVTNRTPQAQSLLQRTPCHHNESIDTQVASERIQNLENCWPRRSGNRIRVMHTLWEDMCNLKSSNLFTEFERVATAIPQKVPELSRRGVDSGVRDRLESFLGLSHSAEYRIDRSGASGSNSQRDQSPSAEHARPTSTHLPPAEILDTGLDLYFRHFHPLIPFVHIPTFSSQRADDALLFIMCLIGLTLIDSNGSIAFVQQAFDIVLGKVEAQLSSYVLRGKVCSNRMMATMASGVLLICLAEVLGDKVDLTRCQRMYVQLIVEAQEQQLFAADNVPALNNDTFEQGQEPEGRWKAWSRVESAKRVIVSLILVDSWTAAVQSACPMLRTDNIQVLLPCDSVLFQAKSAPEWLKLLSSGHEKFMPTLKLSSTDVTIPHVVSPMDILGMHGILCTIRLRISEGYYRLLSGTECRTAEESFVPWQTFSFDPRASTTPKLVVEFIDRYGDMLVQLHPNCMVLWHNMCIMLTADLRIFEIAGGCLGPVAARNALEDVRVWTHTRAARRAILHAAQTFKLMSHRKASEGDPYHSCNGLFVSALVLGLYFFMMSSDLEAGDEGSTFELLDDINWTILGSEGLTYDTVDVDDPAINFIRKGGSISFSGVVHHAGCQFARRIVLDFVHLLEEMGKWRVGRYTRILRLMSDTFVDRRA